MKPYPSGEYCVIDEERPRAFTFLGRESPSTKTYTRQLVSKRIAPLSSNKSGFLADGRLTSSDAPAVISGIAARSSLSTAFF